MSIQVNEQVYRGAGWAVVVIAGPENALRVVDAEYISHPDDQAAVEAAIAALKARPAYVEAKPMADAAGAAPDYLERDDAFIVRVAGGMMSCTEFTSGMTAKQRARAGVKNKWF